MKTTRVETRMQNGQTNQTIIEERSPVTTNVDLTVGCGEFCLVVRGKISPTKNIGSDPVELTGIEWGNIGKKVCGHIEREINEAFSDKFENEIYGLIGETLDFVDNTLTPRQRATMINMIRKDMSDLSQDELDSFFPVEAQCEVAA